MSTRHHALHASASAVLLSLMGATLTPATGCMCTQAGCDSGVSVALSLSAEVADVDGGAIRVCLNEACADGSLRFDVESGFVLCDLPGRVVPNCLGEFDDQGEIAFQVRVAVDEDLAEDGDRVSVRITAADGETVLGEREGEVQYETTEPNGALCGPTCYDATL